MNQLPGLAEMERTAGFSDDGAYRYWLARRWGQHSGQQGTATWIMLNPSTADAEVDDPTIRKVVGFSQRWGFGAALVFNLFAYRATDPKQLRQVDDPVGEFNDHYLRGSLFDGIDLVVCAWGSTGDYATRYSRSQKVRELADSTATQLHCLGTTKSGDPRHPLYVPYSRELEVWR